MTDVVLRRYPVGACRLERLMRHDTFSVPATNVRDKCWQRQFVAEYGLFPQPWFAAVERDRVAAANLSDFLLSRPGSYVLKPRFGSNGVGVVRVVSEGDRLTAASDCPDTALFLDEFPAESNLLGCDLVTAVATQRSRFVNRALAGIPEWALELSILEGEIRQDRADGVLFEPRIVVQRTDGEHFVTLGAMCKCIDTPIAAVVARDFREIPLEDALRWFLASRVSPEALGDSVRRGRELILSAGERAAATIAPFVAASGVRVHQFGVDGRLCWNPATNSVEFWFLEFQFGIGRLDVLLPGYQTPRQLRERFGPEVG